MTPQDTMKGKTKLKSEFREYQGGYRPAGIPCEICGVKNKKKYWRTFTQTSWFRGEDETNGNLCDPCYQEIRELTKKERKSLSLRTP